LNPYVSVTISPGSKPEWIRRLNSTYALRSPGAHIPAGYEVRQPPDTALYLPTQDDRIALLKVAQAFWDLPRNLSVVIRAPGKRTFFHAARRG